MFLPNFGPERGMLASNETVDLGVDRTGLVALYLGDGVDKTYNGNTGTPYGNISYGKDSAGRFAYMQGDYNFVGPTGNTAGFSIGNKMNFSYLTDFSWACTFSMLSLPPNNRCGVFGSSFDCAINVYSAPGVMDVGVRSGANIQSITVSGFSWDTRLGEIHTLGFSYVASSQRFYVYLDGVLNNAGGTLVTTATFLCNAWGMEDIAVMNGNTSSAQKKMYRAAVFSRVLSDAEHLSFHKAINFPTNRTNLVVEYLMLGNINDVSGNNYHGNTTGSPSFTANQRGEANSAYALNGTTQQLATPIMNRGAINGYTVCFWYNPTSTIERSRVTTVNNFLANYYGNAGGSGTNFQWFVGNGTAYSAGANAVSFVTFGQWQFVAITYDKVTGRLYKNGVEFQTQAFASGTINLNDYISYGGFGIDQCEGSFGNLMFFERVLSAYEIQCLYYNSL